MKFNISKLYRLKVISLACLIFFILDRIFKYLAVGNKMPYQKNYGIAFSIAIPESLLFYFYIFIFMIFVIIVWGLIETVRNKKNLPITSYQLPITGYLLLIVGITSNVIDRVRFNFIIDYLNFGFFYNNLADIFICAGVIILIYNLVFKKR